MKYAIRLLLVICVLSSAMFAQGVTTAALNGTVVDNAGQPLPGVNIVALHTSTGTKSGTITGPDGHYSLQNVKVGGPYTITASLLGYKGQPKENINIGLGQNLTFDFKLTEEALEGQEVVIVGERNSIMSSGRTGMASNVSVEQISALPSINRSLNDVVRTSPQIVVTFSSTGQGGPSVAGRNPRYNSVQIDGAVNNDIFGLADAGTPGGQTATNPISMDAIQEFQIVVSPFDVRQGGFTGAGINAITRSGTNKIDGSVFGFGRNASLLGKSPDSLKLAFKKFNEYQAGFRVGGPIIENELFFFANGEVTNRDKATDYAIGVGGSRDYGVAKDSLDKFITLLKAKGYDPGSYEDVTANRGSVKLFARLDWNINEFNRLSLRHNFVDADADRFEANGRSLTTFSLTNFNHLFTSMNNQTVLQLNTTVADNMFNELILGYQTIRDKRDPVGARAPEIRVTLPGTGGKQLLAGMERSSQKNSLDQDIFEVTDNFTYVMGDHTITAGTHNEFFSFANLFIQDAYGTYEFNSLNELANGRVNRYRHSYSKIAGVTEPVAEFSVAQYGFYAQDEWTVNPNLKLNVGIRADIPTYGSTPFANDSVVKYYPGEKTDQVPASALMLSPRFGFNYSPFEERTTQIRGGVGIFTGRTPYVWVSNQFSNTGKDFARIDVSNSSGASPLNNPTFFTVNPDSARKAGQYGLAAGATTSINLIDKDFKFPQLLRFNLGIDQELPYNFIGTAEFMYGQNLNEPFYTDLNLKTSTTAKVDSAGLTGDNRPYYGRNAASIYNSNRNTSRTVINSTNFTNVIKLGNTSDGYSYSLSFQLQRSVNEGLGGSVAYNYGIAQDKNSLTSSVAVSNWQNNPIGGNPNDAPLTTSNYEIKHRFVGTLNYVAEFIESQRTTFSLTYIAQSGRPYSFIYDGDLNGDGNTSNDLLYVPKDKTDILLVNSGTSVQAAQSVYDSFDEFINSIPELKDQRGKIFERNTIVEPTTVRADFRLSHLVPVMGKQSVEISLDVLNVGNLINSDWGIVKYANFQTDQLLRFEGYDIGAGTGNTKRPRFSYRGKVERFQIDQIESRWQMQLGVRYNF